MTWMSHSASKPSAKRHAVLLGVAAFISALPHPYPAVAGERGVHGALGEGDGFRTVPIDLFVNGRSEGSIDADLSGETPAVDGARLREVLEPTVEEGVLARIAGNAFSAGPAGAVPLAELNDRGILCEFDSALLQLRMTVPPEKQKAQTLSFGSGAPSLVGDTETPADFSAYVNLGARLDYLSRGPGGPGLESTLPLEFSVGPVVNIKGTVVEAGLTADVADDSRAQVDYARIVKDFPESSLRLDVGSLFMPVTGFMSAASLAGVEIIRDPQMTRYRRPSPGLGEELLIATRSNLSISLNNETLWSAPLEPGRYRVPDLPFVTGVNDLLFTLRDESGAVQTFHRIEPFDSRILQVHDSSYSCALGVPPSTLRNPVASGYFLYGLDPRVTAGVNLQAGFDRQVGGIELIAASPLGTLGGGVGVSAGPSTSPDFAAKAEYRLAFPAGRQMPVIGFSAQYTGRSFLTPGAEQDSNIHSWQLSAAYSQPLPFGFGMSLGVGYRIGRDANPNETTGSLILMKQINASATLSLLLTVQAVAGSPMAPRALLTFTSSPPESRHSISMSTVLTGSTSSVDLNLRPSQKLNAPALFVSMDGLPAGGDTGITGRAGVEYTGSFFQASLSDSFITSSSQAAYSQNRLSLEAGVAVVALDGVVSLSRPVNDSFAVIIPQDNMKNERVVVDPSGDDVAAVSDKGAYGVLPLLKSYVPTPITLDAPEAPPSSAITGFMRILKPTYKSGIPVRVGTRATITAEGTLLFRDGGTIDLRAAEIRSLDAASAQPGEVFTDEQGIFQAYGLSPGRYEIRLRENPDAREAFVIPEKAEGSYPVGPLRLPIEKGELQ